MDQEREGAVIVCYAVMKRFNHGAKKRVSDLRLMNVNPAPISCIAYMNHLAQTLLEYSGQLTPECLLF